MPLLLLLFYLFFNWCMWGLGLGGVVSLQWGFGVACSPWLQCNSDLWRRSSEVLSTDHHPCAMLFMRILLCCAFTGKASAAWGYQVRQLDAEVERLARHRCNHRRTPHIFIPQRWFHFTAVRLPCTVNNPPSVAQNQINWFMHDSLMKICR